MESSASEASLPNCTIFPLDRALSLHSPITCVIFVQTLRTTDKSPSKLQESRRPSWEGMTQNVSGVGSPTPAKAAAAIATSTRNHRRYTPPPASDTSLCNGPSIPITPSKAPACVSESSWCADHQCFSPPSVLVDCQASTESAPSAKVGNDSKIPVLSPKREKSPKNRSEVVRSSGKRFTSATTLREVYNDIIDKNVPIVVELVDEGVGGTYFFKTRTAKGVSRVAVFKPGDEEPCAPNNPKGYSDEDDGEKGGIKPGEGWKREVLAFSLDHYHFANVPETLEVKLPNRLFDKPDEEKGCKQGSLQRFVLNSDGGYCKASCDMGPSAFPTEDVHRIGQLDIRLLNCDRHGGNALVQKNARGEVRLVPIDHSYILPKHAADLDFEWLFWPQSKEPFSAETKAYIAALDPVKDAKISEEFGVEPECIELMHAATLTLQIGCEKGLSLRTIGRFMRRERMYENSEFENAVGAARRPLGPGGEGGDIELTRLKGLLQERLGSLCESPLKKPVQSRPVTLKEQVLAPGVKLEAIPGVGSSYLVKAVDDTCIAVFRPADRKGLDFSGKNLVSREVAAFRLDELSWAGVPETTEMRIPNELFSVAARRGNEPGAVLPFKHGSLQQFIHRPLRTLCGIPPRVLSVSDVHRIGILDIRLCNADRHCRSMLLSQNNDGSSHMYPTGHSSILPSTLADLTSCCWYTWPQAREPFSEEEMQYVQQLDRELDAQVLQDLGIGQECIELQQVSMLVLKEAMAQGFTLQQIAYAFGRTTLAQPSCVEQLVTEVRAPLDTGGQVDFDLLQQVISARLEVFLETVKADDCLGGAEDDEDANCCCCCRDDAESEGTQSGDSDRTGFSFADEEDSALLAFED